MTITCRVLLFAELAERVGRRQVNVDVHADATVADALQQLSQDYPPIAAMRDRLAVAVNDTYARPDHALQFGDEIALIPPVSGG